MTAVRLLNVYRRYGSVPVLRGLHLDVAGGERVAICGANGAGKTTLLRVLAGLLRPSRGSVEVLGGSPRDAGVRRRIGLLAHSPFLYPRLSAAENLRFWGRLYGVDPDVDGALRRVGLDPDDTRPVDTYSQGMRQRAGLARALVATPDLLLLDEPFASLDTEGVTIVRDLLAEPGRTVVMATHDAARARELGARTLTLHDGNLR